MKESVYQKKFVDKMREKFPLMWQAKIHINEMQSSSIPDYLFCINSVFVAIEFKIQRDGRISITPRQIKELNNIADAHGIAIISCYDEDKGKILIRATRLDYQKVFLSKMNRKVKSKTIRIEWDFEFSNYEPCLDLLMLMVETRSGIN